MLKSFNAKPTQDNRYFQQLIEDLRSKPTLCSLEDYPGVTIKQLNLFVEENPLKNPFFGPTQYYYIEDNRLIPTKMVAYGMEKVSGNCYHQICTYIDFHPEIGGRVTTSQGAFLLGNSRDVRMPDVAYSPREIDRTRTPEQLWTYRGEPFTPTLVIEVDTLDGPRSQLQALDYKMKDEYFKHGVKLGWLIDPKNKIMYEYKMDSSGAAYRVDNNSWRDLHGGDVLPGFTLKCYKLELVLYQESFSSDEDEVEQMHCPHRDCHAKLNTSQSIEEHIRWHREEREEKRFRERTG